MRTSDEILSELKKIEDMNRYAREYSISNQPQMERLSLEYDKALQHEAKSAFIAHKDGLKEVGKYL